MKKLLGIVVLGLLLIGCSENKSESNRKKSKIKLSCKIEKIHVIKKFDGTATDTWFDEKFIKDNLSEFAEPITLEILDKSSLAMWMDKQPVLLWNHDERGFSYMNESNTSGQGEGFVNLHYASVNYGNLEFSNEMSMLIKDDDSKYEFGFNNKAEISSIGYGFCKKIK